MPTNTASTSRMWLRGFGHTSGTGPVSGGMRLTEDDAYGVPCDEQLPLVGMA